jgi:hypothetical protein
MWTRFLLPIFVIALTTPCYADDKAITDIADGITSYRLSAQFCHWPIPARIRSVLNSDEIHFTDKNPKTFNLGVKTATDRFHLLTNSNVDYCKEIKDSRRSMTESLEERAK